MKMVGRWVVSAAVAYVIGIICWSATPAADRARYTGADALGTYALVLLVFAGVAVGLAYALGGNRHRHRRRPRDEDD